MTNIVLSTEKLSKSFYIGTGERRTIFSSIRANLSGDMPRRKIWALKNINFKVRKGEMVAVLGPNGSGKTTLLRILAGIIKPTRGNFSVSGEVSTMFELGIGFNPMFTAMQNLYLYGALHGLSRKQIDEKLDKIVEFSQLGDFMYAKLREFSSGMRQRLAFATVMQTANGIIMVDEALSVGDVSFQKKCHEAFEFLLSKGCTLIYVTQVLGAEARALCDKALYIDSGEQKGFGPVNEVEKKYIYDSDCNRLKGLRR